MTARSNKGSAALVEASVLDKVELLYGRVAMGEYELVFSLKQAAAAARLGVCDIRTCWV